MCGRTSRSRASQIGGTRTRTSRRIHKSSYYRFAFLLLNIKIKKLQVMTPISDACTIMQSEQTIDWGYHCPLIDKTIKSVENINGLIYCEPLKEAIQDFTTDSQITSVFTKLVQLPYIL
jgi:hypothetical protein